MAIRLGEKVVLVQQEINELARQADRNAKEALGLNDSNSKKEEKNNPEILTPDGYRHCKLILGVEYASGIYQFTTDLLLTDAEAYSAYRLLAMKMEELTTTKLPVSLSMKVRNADRKVVCRCYTGIVFMEHDIPEIADIEEDEDAER